MVSTEKELTWDEAREITEKLNTDLMPINQESLAKIASAPGIVAWYYSGEELGFGLWRGTGYRMVYVGRTGEDVLRHFLNGRTGDSTVRRSLTALLYNKYDLQPIPRGNDAEDKDRFTNYALDESSDDRLTRWISSNIQIAFYPASRSKLDMIKQGLINYNTPLFNLQNNPENKYGAEVKVLRKKCADLALEYEK